MNGEAVLVSGAYCSGWPLCGEPNAALELQFMPSTCNSVHADTLSDPCFSWIFIINSGYGYL